MRRNHWWKVVAVLALIWLGVVTFLASVDKSEENIRAAQIASCERGNVVVSVGIIDAGQNARKPRRRQATLLNIYSVRDCETTNSTGKATPLTTAKRDEYIDGIARLMSVDDWNKQDDVHTHAHR